MRALEITSVSYCNGNLKKLLVAIEQYSYCFNLFSVFIMILLPSNMLINRMYTVRGAYILLLRYLHLVRALHFDMCKKPASYI